MTQKPGKPKRFPFLVGSVAMVALLLGIGIFLLKQNYAGKLPIDTHSNLTGGTHSTNGAVSPLLFGTNLSLFSSNGHVLNSSGTRAQLQHMHIRIISMPVRPELSNDTEIQAAQAIKSIGAYALVILRGAVDNNVLADDTRLITDMNSVFGNTIVYY